MIVEVDIFSLTNLKLTKLHELDQKCLPDQAWSAEAWKSLTVYGENYYVWTIEKADEFIASMLVLSLPYEEMLHLLKIMVAPQSRKSGLGQKLIEKLIEKAKELKFKSLLLEVEFDNGPAIALYEKNGFQITRRVNKFYTNGKDALVMIKPIQD